MIQGAMFDRFVSSARGVWRLLAVVALLSPAYLSGQAPAPAKPTSASSAKKAWTPPRTAWGDPDLEGTWNFATLTPLERPGELTGKETLTNEEAAAFEQKTLKERTATL